ncbi:MAG: DUF1636 family protein [Planktomarina sp.]
MTTWITICDTCKREGWDPTEQQQTDGEILAEMIETAASDTSVKTRRVSCMMGCKRACNIAVQGPDKLSYVLGVFDPSQDDAQAIVDYAKLYDESETGQVPFRQWPVGVKGHFTSRLTPLPKAD